MNAAGITPEQSRAINSLSPNICVSAAAGSGKTGVLARRYAKIIAESLTGTQKISEAASRILVITFTDRAAREMQLRIAAELHKENLIDHSNDLAHAYISTIHSFCARILRENPFESGLHPGFKILTDTEAARLIRSCALSALDEALFAPAQHPEIHALICAAMTTPFTSESDNLVPAKLAHEAEKILRNVRGRGLSLTEIGRLAQNRDPASLPIFADAPDQALTQLVNAASAEGLESLYMAATCARDAVVRPPVVNAPTSGLSEALRLLQQPGIMPHGLNKSEADRSANYRVLNIQNLLHNTCTVLASAEHTYRIERESAEAIRAILMLAYRIDKDYSALKQDTGALDIEDLQIRCAGMLDRNPGVCSRYRSQFRHILVDEFQDTDPLQARILQLLHPEITETPDNHQYSDTCVSQNSIFVVGDVRQSIYSFRGADPAIFQNLHSRFQAAPNKSEYDHISLTHNFRSRPEILTLVGAVFDNTSTHALPAKAEMTAGQPYLPVCGPRVEFLVSHDLARQQYAASEASALASHLLALVNSDAITISGCNDVRQGQPVTWSDVMVLFRSHADIQPWVKAFESAGIPVSTSSADRQLLHCTEICDLLDFLTIVLHPHDDIALLTVLRSPFVGITLPSVCELLRRANRKQGEIYPALISCLHDKSLTPSDLTASQGILEALHLAQYDCAFLSPSELLERVLRVTGYEQKLRTQPDGDAAAENVRRFVQFVVSEYSEDYDISEVLKKLRELQTLEMREIGEPQSEQAGGVRFLTIHAAKGLEAPVVALADLSRSLLARDADLFATDLSTLKIGSRITGKPDTTYATLLDQHLERDAEEMKRLLYVALTRAREHLILCGNIGRNRGFNWADMIFSALDITQNTPDGQVSLLNGNLMAALHRHGAPSP